MASGDGLPALMKRLAGDGYDGPLSDYDEWHAAEMGLFVGLILGATGSWELVAGFVAVALGKRAATGEIQKQVRQEPHYFAVGFTLGFSIGLWGKATIL